MAVKLSEKAANEVKKIIAEQKLDAATVLRVGVCRRRLQRLLLQPRFRFANGPGRRHEFECHGVTVVVDKKSELFLDGTTLIFTTASRNAASRSTTPTP